ncbi:MAG: hypothetical protein AAFR61_27435 [Bacteroidota bacterium]
MKRWIVLTALLWGMSSLSAQIARNYIGVQGSWMYSDFNVRIPFAIQDLATDLIVERSLLHEPEAGFSVGVHGQYRLKRSHALHYGVRLSSSSQSFLGKVTPDFRDLNFFQTDRSTFVLQSEGKTTYTFTDLQLGWKSYVHFRRFSLFGMPVLEANLLVKNSTTRTLTFLSEATQTDEGLVDDFSDYQTLNFSYGLTSGVEFPLGKKQSMSLFGSLVRRFMRFQQDAGGSDLRGSFIYAGLTLNRHLD